MLFLPFIFIYPKRPWLRGAFSIRPTVCVDFGREWTLLESRKKFGVRKILKNTAESPSFNAHFVWREVDH